LASVLNDRTVGYVAVADEGCPAQAVLKAVDRIGVALPADSGVGTEYVRKGP
jgi:hypothetical protein